MSGTGGPMIARSSLRFMDVLVRVWADRIDTVQSAVTLTLGANVENLTLTGTTGINGTGIRWTTC